ncbi:zinc finger protein 385A-like [Salminus brasiliensis]|uniref:zinc finger protein 385A-like n=1 Tax=Salminus brasiliensis TaxID=930266 RepID=UPI003B83274E
MAMQISAVHGSHGTVSGQVERVMKEPCASLSLSDEQSEESNVNRQLFCSLCKIAVNSPSQLQEHSRGTKHKTILEARSGLGPIKAYPRLCFSTSLSHSTPERTFHCEICNVRINSEPQLKQHISSRRHRDAVAGKSNPLTNRHKSLSSAELVVILISV